MIENFLLGILNFETCKWRCQAVAFMFALSPFSCYLNFAHTFEMGVLSPFHR